MSGIVSSSSGVVNTSKVAERDVCVCVFFAEEGSSSKERRVEDDSEQEDKTRRRRTRQDDRQQVMQWITGQGHVHITSAQREIPKIHFEFDHDCQLPYGQHSLCAPLVNACSCAVTLPTHT